MPTLITDRDLERRLRRQRRRTGADRWDEVWEGTYVMSPLPNNQHQYLGRLISVPLGEMVDAVGLGQTFIGCNVSDRRAGWKKNFRCPDVAVYLTGNPAEDCGTHWFGGPDLAIEIVSPGDRSRDKIPFYAAVGTRELLILDRDPWRLELYRLTDGELRSAGAITPDEAGSLQTTSVAFDWRFVTSPERPRLELTTPDGRRWEA